METIYQQVFERFCQECPDFVCGVYDAGQKLRMGKGPCPRKCPAALEAGPAGDGAYCAGVQLPEGWTLWFRGGARQEDAERAQQLACSIRRILLQNQDLSADKNSSQDKMSMLLNRLFTLSSADDIAYTAMSAVSMGYDLTLPRVICLFKLQGSDDNSIPDESVLRSIINIIRNQGGTSPQDMIGRVNSNQIVLCKILPDRERSIQQLCQPLLAAICSSLLELYHISAQVGIGERCISISDYSTSFLDICQVLRCQELLCDRRAFNYVSDCQHLLEILQIPHERIDHFLGEKLDMIERSPQFLETVGALIACNMNINDTAEALYVHRNTVLFRVNRIKKMLCIDPLHRDNDRALLRLLYLYARLRPIMASGPAGLSTTTNH